MSTPMPARSASAPITSSSVSPMPRIRPDLVVRPAALARASTDRLRAYPAEGRTARCRRATVSRLWLRMSGRTANSRSRESPFPLASLISVSTMIPSTRRRMASTVSATMAKPPSGRSSLATMVSTAWPRPRRSTASATRSGSDASTAWGLRVSTRQKPQARVQRSPSTMNVAVPSAQHSDRLGQPASSQTVTRPRSRTARFSARTSSPWCTLGRSQSGFRVEIANPPTTPASASRPLRWCVTSRTGAPAPPPREKADRSSGRWRQATSWRSATPPPQAAEARAATASAACAQVHRDSLGRQ